MWNDTQTDRHIFLRSRSARQRKGGQVPDVKLNFESLENLETGIIF